MKLDSKKFCVIGEKKIHEFENKCEHDNNI